MIQLEDTQIPSEENPTVIDLFSGAGLLGYGFHSAGFKLLAAYEFDQAAATTHGRNLPGKIEHVDLSKKKPEGRADVIIAGPPCQGFSSIGTRDTDDPRNAMCLIIPKWAKVVDAKIVVIENVPTFLDSQACLRMKGQLRRQGYEVRSDILNAKDFGVAQNRVRSFTICSKIGLPELKPSTSLAHAVTIRDAWSGLPSFPCNEIQHYTLAQSAQAMNRITRIPEGGDIRHLAETAPHLVPPSWFKTNGKIIDIWGRMRLDGISNTLRTGFLNPSRGRFLHPAENRPISFREAARIQGLPDDFIFSGTASQIARQIGNGVPVGLGYSVAQSIMTMFKKAAP